MDLLVDTRLLLWAAGDTRKLSADSKALLQDEANTLWFSAASLWELTIKAGLGRADFVVDPHILRRGLLDNDWKELAITSAHVIATGALPALHKDPFDRVLLAQAAQDGLLLVTTDAVLAQYPGPVRRV
ncbi:MAG: type II toxin-antitoxin system VapC family toxin [Pseudomonadota bacterium]